jgi:ATP/maltotriose-dependent transcriptional regulator MalT
LPTAGRSEAENRRCADGVLRRFSLTSCLAANFSTPLLHRLAHPLRSRKKLTMHSRTADTRAGKVSGGGPSATNSKSETDRPQQCQEDKIMLQQTNALSAADCRFLTSRKREVVSLVSQGLSNKEVAQRLNIIEGTVKLHLRRIYSQLGVRNRTPLAVLAMRSAASD